MQGDRYDDDARRAAVVEALRARLGALPGVEQAALLSSLPLGGGGFYLGRTFLPEGDPDARKDRLFNVLRGQYSLGPSNYAGEFPHVRYSAACRS